MTTRDRILLTLLLYQGKASYQKVYSFLPPGYDQPNFYGILRRMEQDQLIKRSLGRHSRDIVDPEQSRRIIDSSVAEPFAKIPRLAALRLGPDALSFLESRFGPRIRSLLDPSTRRLAHDDQGKSSTFSLVIYDFPLQMAYHRARLQIKLERLGMGMLRKGVYISPYDVLKTVSVWAEENKILSYVYLMQVAPSNPSNPSTHLEKIWPLSQISHLYLSLLDRLAIVKGQQIKEKRLSGLHRIKSDFLDLVSRDPLLPKPLAATDWPLQRVLEALIGID